MNSELQEFASVEFGSVRVVEIDNTPWFVASDVAKALGYVNTKDAVRRHCKKVNDYEGARNAPIEITNKNVPAPNLIPRGDVYRLIVSSKLPTAERFESWVFDELLTVVHDKGIYVDEARVDPAFLRQIADELEEKSRQLRAARPALTLCNRLTAHRTEWPLNIAAKEVGVHVNFIRNLCVAQGFLKRVNSYGRNRFLPTKKAEQLGICVREPGGEKYAFTRGGITWLRNHVPA